MLSVLFPDADADPRVFAAVRHHVQQDFLHAQPKAVNVQPVQAPLFQIRLQFRGDRFDSGRVQRIFFVLSAIP